MWDTLCFLAASSKKCGFTVVPRKNFTITVYSYPKPKKESVENRIMHWKLKGKLSLLPTWQPIVKRVSRCNYSVFFATLSKS